MATTKAEQFWQQHVDARHASGLTPLQYSKRHRLTTASLSNWSSVLDAPSTDYTWAGAGAGTCK